MRSSSRLSWLIVIVLFVIILVLSWILFTTPRSDSNPRPVATSTSAKATTMKIDTSPAPLSAQVSITSPQENSTVGHTFDVSGQAPAGWFFEAQFPIQVRDASDNVIGRATGSAQGDWQTKNLVTFKATIHIDDPYRGPATLILMKDNPSGLPENDDAVSIPIVIE